MLGKEFVDLAVPRYRLQRACLRIAIPIVASAMPHENASLLIQFSDKI